jgi:hypothetical protein
LSPARRALIAGFSTRDLDSPRGIFALGAVDRLFAEKLSKVATNIIRPITAQKICSGVMLVFSLPVHHFDAANQTRDATLGFVVPEPFSNQYEVSAVSGFQYGD